MEVLGGRGAVAHLHVVLGAQLQEPLNAGARVLGPLAFITMRQQENESVRLTPLGFRGRQELVDDDLRAVYEIAELRFPKHERVRLDEADARTRIP